MEQRRRAFLDCRIAGPHIRKAVAPRPKSRKPRIGDFHLRHRRRPDTAATLVTAGRNCLLFCAAKLALVDAKGFGNRAVRVRGKAGSFRPIRDCGGGPDKGPVPVSTNIRSSVPSEKIRAGLGFGEMR